MPDLKHPQDYSLFLLIYIASVDGSFHPAEHDAVTEKITQLFPELEVPEQKIDEMVSFIRKTGMERAEEMVKENLDALHPMSPGNRKQLYAFLFEILNADGRVHEEEIRIIRLLKDHLND